MKIQYDLGKVGKSISLKLCVYAEEVPIGNRIPNKSYTIEKIRFKGLDTIKYSPRPFITLSIDDYDNDLKVRNSQSSYVNLNRISIFNLIYGIRRFIKNYVDMPIYKYYNNRLILDSDMMDKAKVNIPVNNGNITLMPTISTSSDNPDIEVEAIEFIINNNPVSATMNISELKYLLWRLEHTDIETIAATLLTKYDTSNNIREIKTQSDMEYDNYQRVVEDNNTSYGNTPLMSESRIPSF